MNNTDGKQTQRLPLPRSSGIYSINRRSSEDHTKIGITAVGDDVAITVDGQHLSLSRAAAKRLVVALLEVID